MNKFAFCPKTDFNLVIDLIHRKMQFDIIPGINARDLEGVTCDRNSAVSVGDPFLANAENIFDGGKRLGQSKRTKEGAVIFASIFKTQSGISWVVE